MARQTRERLCEEPADDPWDESYNDPIDESKDGSKDRRPSHKLGIRIPSEFREKDRAYILFHNDDIYNF